MTESNLDTVEKREKRFASSADANYISVIAVISELRKIGLTAYVPFLSEGVYSKDGLIARSRNDYIYRIKVVRGRVLNEKDRKKRVKITMYPGKKPKEEAGTFRNTYVNRMAELKANTDIVAVHLPIGLRVPRLFWMPSDHIDPSKKVISIPAAELIEDYSEFCWDSYYQL